VPRPIRSTQRLRASERALAAGAAICQPKNLRLKVGSSKFTSPGGIDRAVCIRSNPSESVRRAVCDSSNPSNSFPQAVWNSSNPSNSVPRAVWNSSNPSKSFPRTVCDSSNPSESVRRAVCNSATPSVGVVRTVCTGTNPSTRVFQMMCTTSDPTISRSHPPKRRRTPPFLQQPLPAGCGRGSKEWLRGGSSSREVTAPRCSSEVKP